VDVWTRAGQSLRKPGPIPPNYACRRYGCNAPHFSYRAQIAAHLRHRIASAHPSPAKRTGPSASPTMRVATPGRATTDTHPDVRHSRATASTVHRRRRRATTHRHPWSMVSCDGFPVRLSHHRMRTITPLAATRRQAGAPQPPRPHFATSCHGRPAACHRTDRAAGNAPSVCLYAITASSPSM